MLSPTQTTQPCVVSINSFRFPSLPRFVPFAPEPRTPEDKQRQQRSDRQSNKASPPSWLAFSDLFDVHSKNAGYQLQWKVYDCESRQEGRACSLLFHDLRILSHDRRVLAHDLGIFHHDFRVMYGNGCNEELNLLVGGFVDNLESAWKFGKLFSQCRHVKFAREWHPGCRFGLAFRIIL